MHTVAPHIATLHLLNDALCRRCHRRGRGCHCPRDARDVWPHERPRPRSLHAGEKRKDERVYFDVLCCVRRAMMLICSIHVNYILTPTMSPFLRTSVTLLHPAHTNGQPPRRQRRRAQPRKVRTTHLQYKGAVLYLFQICFTKLDTEKHDSLRGTSRVSTGTVTP